MKVISLSRGYPSQDSDGKRTGVFSSGIVSAQPC
jgi:hypothetical protein